MNKRHVLIMLMATATAALLAILFSENSGMWIISILTLPAFYFLCSSIGMPRVLLFILGIDWLQIVGNIMIADLNGVSLAATEFGSNVERATIYSLIATLVIALGMRCGFWSSGKMFSGFTGTGSGNDAAIEPRFDVSRLFICYAAFALVATLLPIVGRIVPGLTQFALSIGFVKFAFVYLIAAVVLKTGRGYHWLILATVAEVTTGLVSFFSSYKEAVFVILIAAASTRRSTGLKTWVFGTVAAVGIVWISLVWTVIKVDYREVMYDMTLEQRAHFMVDRYSEGIDLGDAFSKLLERIEYTTLFARVIARDEAGDLYKDENYYLDALIHVSTPRLIFADKAPLSDSQKTTELLDVDIAEDTSIGIGFVAQAYADFGFPALLLPMFLIGGLLGLAAGYFMTRNLPLVVREAFATAALFSCFKFEFNIDKSLGGFLMTWLVLGLFLKFIYPLISPMLFDPRRPVRQYAPIMNRR